MCLACVFDSALADSSAGEEELTTDAGNGFRDLSPPAGGTFGKYRLKKELGSGGMGVIWEAEDTSLRRTVAIKMIRGFAFSSASERQRFQREATAVAQLDHPNIVPIYEVGEIEGQPYFAMKQLTGGTLSARLAEGAMDQRKAAMIMKKLAQAIAQAHERGILHRDLKPDNVLFDHAGKPHLSDFGLAKMLDEGDGLTLTTAHVGTPHYMSPEQARGRAKDITAASDVWGAGALLFHMLTGRTPFGGESSGEILHHVANDSPRPMDDAIPAIDKDLRTLCLRCLERDPEQRVPNADFLAKELSRWLKGQPIATKEAPLATKAWRWIRQKPLMKAALLLGLLLMTFAAVSLPQKRGGDASLDAGRASEHMIKYGDTISLRNLSNDEFLDTCGYVINSELGTILNSQNLFVFTSDILNRGDRPTGTWLIESSTGIGYGTPLSFGDRIHLKNLYPEAGWLDNCGLLVDLPLYHKFVASQQAAVSTSSYRGEVDGTDTWIVRSPQGKTGPLKVGGAVVLESTFAGGGHLNAAGKASSISEFTAGFENISSIVFVSKKGEAAGPSGQWKVEKTK